MSTAYALNISAGPSGGDPCVVGLFETQNAAAEYYRGRDDLAGYFWNVNQEFPVSESLALPRIFWTRERVSAAMEETA